MRARKLLAWLFTGTAVLLAVLLSLLLLVDVNLYRDQIERRVSTLFGREVVLGGPLSLQVSLTPRIVVEQVKIANPDWASRPFMADVQRFGVRVSLLPLLAGRLQIDALELHGVDLLLEENPAGANNFTFAGSGESSGLPDLRRLSLHDAKLAYAAADAPVRRLQVRQLSLHNPPGEPLQVNLLTSLKGLPVTLAGEAGPPSTGELQQPWTIVVQGEIGSLSLQAEGHVDALRNWQRGEYRVSMNGRNSDALETLSGYTLPVSGAYRLSAALRFDRHSYLAVSQLSAELGDSDIRGNLYWDMAAEPSRLRLRLHSGQIDASAWQGGDTDSEPLQQVIDTRGLRRLQVDAEVAVQRLRTAQGELQDLALKARSNSNELRISQLAATLDATRIEANAMLSWNNPPGTRENADETLESLLQRATLDVSAEALDSDAPVVKLLAQPSISLALTRITASARPQSALQVQAQAALNGKPVELRLQAEPLVKVLQRPAGPWRNLSLDGQGEDIRISASGAVEHPFELHGFAVDYRLQGNDIAAYLPLHGAWSLSGRYRDAADYRRIDDLRLALGRSDLRGAVSLHHDAARPRINANLRAGRIDMDQQRPLAAPGSPATDVWNQPLDLDGLADHDLDITVQVAQLLMPGQAADDIHLNARADARALQLNLSKARLAGTPIDARLELPWGSALPASRARIRLGQLLKHAAFRLRAQPAPGSLQHRAYLMSHVLDLELGAVQAVAEPGEPLQVSAHALIDGTALRARLQAGSLADLLRHPAGPWRDLSLRIENEDLQFAASGSVERPFEAAGFDVRYRVRGEQINTLLPLFNLVLPLEGAYALTGRFIDRPDRLDFDDLEILWGRNDIRGSISIHQEQPRPRIIADFRSDQIYFSSLVPVTAEQKPAAASRVIPDYALPIETLRGFDGQLSFTGKRLRTIGGDLGDIRFDATLQDGVFTLDPFAVRGWAGARVESTLSIDANQEPPQVDWRWQARQLNYGVVLEQLGLAENVEGKLDITLRLSGAGRTRHELLSNADGQLIVVGKQGRFGSRRLDLWGSALITTMLSSDWRQDDVTQLNCLVARLRIEDGVASTDKAIVDTRRVTIAASGTLDLESETLNLVLAPRPKRATLLALTNPVHVTGTLSEPEVGVTVLPRNRMAAAGTGMLAGLINPGYLIFTFTQTGSAQADACEAAVADAMALKEFRETPEPPPETPAPRRFSLFPGCTPASRAASQ